MKPVSKTLFCIMVVALAAACDGKKPAGGAEAPLPEVVHPGTSGSVCITPDYAYRLKEGNTEEVKVRFTPEPLLAQFKGNMGGQIRALTTSESLLVWGGGSSIRYGNADVTLGSVGLSQQGLVSGLATLVSSRGMRVAFGTERGFGLLKVDESGNLIEVAEAKRVFPPGVAAIAAGVGNARDDILLTTAEGFLLKTTVGDLEGGNTCLDLVASKDVMVENDTTFRPTKIVPISEGKTVVLGLSRPAELNLAPSNEEAFGALCEGIVAAKPSAIVRVIDLPSHQVGAVGYDALDGSFDAYDQFVPTDVAFDGTALYVAGFLYEQTAIESYLNSNCADGDDAVRAACLCDGAARGVLAELRGTGGVSASGSGFFVYRNLSDLRQPAHFEWIPLSMFRHQVGTAPFAFRLLSQGGKLFFRAPHFMLELSKGEDPIRRGERWTVVKSYDAASGLLPGIPEDLEVVNSEEGTGVAVAVTAARADDGTGGSTLETLSSDETTFKAIDTGAIATRIEGASSSLIAAIDLMNRIGGTLYLQNTAERRRIEVESPSPLPLVAHAAYQGGRLAFVWTEGSSTANPIPAWRLAVQNGSNVDSRGEMGIPKQGTAGIFDGFPDVSGGADDAIRRGIGDVELAAPFVFVLFEGFADGSWSDQVGMLTYLPDNTPRLVAITDTLATPGSQTFPGGSITRVTQEGESYIVHFSAVDGMHRTAMIAGTPSERATAMIERDFTAPRLVRVGCDTAGSSLCAAIGGYTLQFRDATDPAVPRGTARLEQAEGATFDRLYDATLSLVGSRLYVVTPLGSTATFYAIDASNPSTPSVLQTCVTCRFNAVAAFPQFPDYLIVSSPTGGVEIYDVSDQ